MQVEVPQIVWHDESARIMAIDFYPNSNYFVTSSIVTDHDSGIRLWKLKKKPQFHFNPSVSGQSPFGGQTDTQRSTLAAGQ